MMSSDDRRLHLLAITADVRDGTDGLVARAAAAERGGATMVLLRLKHADARTLVEVGGAMVGALTIPLLVSDRLDVALASGAAGVHVTSEGIPAIAMRSHLPPAFLIAGSVSSASDVERMRAADFVTIGPVFGENPAAIGLDGLSRLVAQCPCPAIAIGGINASNVAAVRLAGAAGVAAIRAIFAADDPAAAAALLLPPMSA